NACKIKKINIPLVKIHLHDGERIRHNHKGLYSGTKRILKKHSELFSQNRKVHYNYLSVVAVNAFKTGRISEGKKFLHQAIKLNPLGIKNIIRLIILKIPFLRKK